MATVPAPASRPQIWLLLTMLAVIAATWGGVVWASRTTDVVDRHLDRLVAEQREQNLTFLYDHGYIDDADYVLVEQLALHDHARGGVYFIGDSQTRVAIMPWLLPPEEQQLIRNYGLGDLRYRDLRFFTRLLIDDYGILQAGPENVTIILGLSFYMARAKDYAHESYVSAAFKRHGLFTYDGEAGIHRAPLSAVERFVRLRRIEANRFLRTLVFQPNRVKPFDPATHAPGAEVQEPGWEAAQAREIAELELLLDDLAARRVRVIALFRPNGTWTDYLPYEAAFRARVAPMLEARGVQLIDQGDLLADADFGDAAHANYRGQHIIHGQDRQIALEALAEMGIAIGP